MARAIVAATLMAATGMAATREEVLEGAVVVGERLVEVSSFDRSWYDAPFLAGAVLLDEALVEVGSDRGRELAELAGSVIGEGRERVIHGDDAAYAQAALDLLRRTPAGDPARQHWRDTVAGPLEFARLALAHTAADGAPIPGLWRDPDIGYGCRYWQDDVFMMVPWLALLGSTGDDLPGDPVARDLAYEWIEAYAFDHRRATDGLGDGRVPTRPDRRRTGWALGDPASGRLLWDPATQLWWHDEASPSGGRYWTRGNGWVMAGLVRAQSFLDLPYAGGRYERWLGRVELRAMLTRMAARLLAERTVYGTWTSDVFGRGGSAVPESSGSALIVFALARAVNEGWLAEEPSAAAAAKAFRALSLAVDEDGDLHHIQRAAAGPDSSELRASDDPDLNLNYGPGAYLLAAAEVARLPGLEGLDRGEVTTVARERWAVDGEDLVVDAAELGEVGSLAADGAELGAMAGQLFLTAAFDPASGLVRVADDGGSGPVTVFADPGVAPTYRSLIPAVAHTPGLEGSRWTSTVALHNPGPAPVTATLELRPWEGAARRAEVTVAAGGSRVEVDVVGGLFAAAGAGSLLVEAPAPLLVTSTTASDLGQGAFGQHIPAAERSRALVGGDEARLLLLGGSPARRTNLGVASFSAEPAMVRFELRGAEGSFHGGALLAVPARGAVQMNDVLGGHLPDVFAVVEVVGGGAVLPYASVVDNLSNDPTVILPAESVAAPRTADPPVPAELWVAAVAHVDGLAGTRWRTELEIHNPGPGAAAVALTLYPAGGGRGVEGPVVELGVGARRRWGDVVDEVFAVDGAGSLRLEPRVGQIMAASRTFTDSGAGSHGQGIPAVPAQRAVHAGETGVLGHLELSPSPTTGARTNLGLVNTRPEPAAVVIEVVDDAGSPLGERTETLAPFEYRQLTDLHRWLGGPARRGVVARVTPVGERDRVLAYASVVDNRSGDARFQLATVVAGGG